MNIQYNEEVNTSDDPTLSKQFCLHGFCLIGALFALTLGLSVLLLPVDMPVNISNTMPGQCHAH